MKITYSITKDDFWNYSKYTRSQSPNFKTTVAVAVLASLMVSSGMFVLFNSIKISLLILIPIIIVFFLSAYPICKYRTLKYLENDKNALDEQTVEISPEGISRVTNSQDGFSKWDVISKIKTTNEYIYIYFNPVAAIVVPKRIFNSESEAVEFYNTANNYFESNKNNS